MAVVALVGPASRSVRPSILLENARATVGMAADATNAVASRPVTSSSRPRTTEVSSPVGAFVPLGAAERAASCIPCVAGAESFAPAKVGRPNVPRQERPAPVVAPAAPGSGRGDEGVPAAAASEAVAASPAAAPARTPARTSPAPADRRAEAADRGAAERGPDRSAKGPGAVGQADGGSAQGASAQAEDRPGNAPSSTPGPQPKAKDR